MGTDYYVVFSCIHVYEVSIIDSKNRIREEEVICRFRKYIFFLLIFPVQRISHRHHRTKEEIKPVIPNETSLFGESKGNTDILCITLT